MIIAYYSLTGNIRDFIAWFMPDTYQYHDIMKDGDLAEDYVLITPTHGFGCVPDDVAVWLQRNHGGIQGVIGSGQRNWGENYAKAAYTIADMYDVPVIQTFELRGSPAVAREITQKINEMGTII